MPRQPAMLDALRAYGCTLVETDGWRERGSEAFSPHGVGCHHIGGASAGEMPSLRTLINGRSDLPGPLCNIGLSRGGVCDLVAAGRANHMGKGSWRGIVGNSGFWGIEPENDGRQPWPEVQLRAYHRATAALISLTPNRDYRDACGHKEYATPPGRKPDPHTLSMDNFRSEVSRVRPIQQEGDVQLKVWNVPGNPELSLTFGKDVHSLPWKRLVIADGEVAQALVELPGVVREPQSAETMGKVKSFGVIRKVA